MMARNANASDILGRPNHQAIMAYVLVLIYLAAYTLSK